MSKDEHKERQRVTKGTITHAVAPHGSIGSSHITGYISPTNDTYPFFSFTSLLSYHYIQLATTVESKSFAVDVFSKS